VGRGLLPGRRRGHATFAEVLAGGFDLIGVDMPIGLLPGPQRKRACDVEARQVLGRGRASSVFPAPLRPVIDASSREEAAALAWKAGGVLISHQAFGLVAKIRELDALLTPALQDRVMEVHPEVSLCVLAGRPMAFSKHTSGGRAERLTALSAVFPDVFVGTLRGAAADDVLDAYAVLWSAGRLARGQAVRLGDGSVDERGLRMEIVV
jgi:predicted RNase H-like nuclease